LQERKSNLIDIKNRLMMCQLIINNVGEYPTKIIGGVNVSTVSHKRNYVKKAGGLGLVISLFLAFIVDYVVRANKIEKHGKR